jgi:haloacetate dehalogenase
LWGGAGIASSASGPLDAWRRWATDVRGHAVDSGHFLAEESPEETSAALFKFFSE